MQDLQDEYFKTKTNLQLLKIASAALIVKCPLFVQLNMMQYGLDVVVTPSDSVEAYIPDLSMVEGNTLEDRKRLVHYLQATTEALLLNQQGIPMDGGSEFTAQLTTPISVYNEIIVSGSLRKWVEYLGQKRLPKEIELYRDKILELLRTEWKNIDRLLQILK